MWEINIGDQALTFLMSLALGGVICLIYDVFRSVRIAAEHNAVKVFFEDIFFWLIAAFVTFMFLMGRTGGGIRGYVLFGALLGFFVIRLTLSRLFVFLLSGAFLYTLKFYSLVCRLSQRSLDHFCGFFTQFLRFLEKNLKRVLKTLKKLLKSRSDMLYTEKNSDLQINREE